MRFIAITGGRVLEMMHVSGAERRKVQPVGDADNNAPWEPWWTGREQELGQAQALVRIDQRSRRKTARLAVKEDREAALGGSVMSVERLAKVESKLPGELLQC